MSKKFFLFCTCLIMCFFTPFSIHAQEGIYLGGDSVGIEVGYGGVLISGTYTFQVQHKTYDPSPALQKKDILKEINGVAITSIADMQKQLLSYQEAVNTIPVTIRRGDATLSSTLYSVYDEQAKVYKSGLYVKDKIVGVGTMTYYDPSNSTYGALGHEIMDADLQEIAKIHSGSIYPAYVSSLQKAQPTQAGEKHATIDFTQVLGSVGSNTSIGIYGTYDTMPHDAVKMPWAKQDEVHTGEATLYTVLHGTKVEGYRVHITKVHHQNTAAVKGIEFVIEDEQLLSQTNGIIQGMSGSPLVQDGKIIGAVTHVITNDPVKGYGVFIEWMLHSSRQQG